MKSFGSAAAMAFEATLAAFSICRATSVATRHPKRRYRSFSDCGESGEIGGSRSAERLRHGEEACGDASWHGEARAIWQRPAEV